MKRRKNEMSDIDTRDIDTRDIDKRVIDLRRAIPTYIPWPSGPLNLTLCAGDGVQNYEGRSGTDLTTDIEWFTQRYEGHFRETKPTNIFCCSPDYNEPGIEENKNYLHKNPGLDVLLVLCDTTNPVHLNLFAEMFKNKLTTINEDMACYGPALSPEILTRVLVSGGQYIIDDAMKIRGYKTKDLTNSLSITTPEFNKMVITKRATKGGRKSRKYQNKKRRDHKAVETMRLSLNTLGSLKKLK